MLPIHRAAARNYGMTQDGEGRPASRLALNALVLNREPNVTPFVEIPRMDGQGQHAFPLQRQGTWIESVYTGSGDEPATMFSAANVLVPPHATEVRFGAQVDNGAVLWDPPQRIRTGTY